MHTGKLIFAQLMEHLPLTTFRRCVARYGGHHKVKRFSCLDQYLSMGFAQLTYRESLRDIEVGFPVPLPSSHHLGLPRLRRAITLPNANRPRVCRPTAA